MDIMRVIKEQVEDNTVNHASADIREYHIEKLSRDAKLLELGAGTTDINLLAAARSELGI